MINPNDIITIRKGVAIKTMHPKGDYTAGRTYKVRVDHVLPGVTMDGVVQSESRVVWKGNAGYWCEVLVSDVTLAVANKDRFDLFSPENAFSVVNENAYTGDVVE